MSPPSPPSTQSAEPELTNVRFSDFTPGIRDNPGAQYPPGTASTSYRCISLPGGGLTPLPRRSTIYNGYDPLSANPASGVYLVNGMFALGPIVIKSGTDSAIHAQLFLGLEYVNGGNRVFFLRRARIDENPVVNETVKTFTVAEAGTAATGWGLSWGMTRAKQGWVVGDAAIPVLFFAWASAGNQAASWFVDEFPNDTAPTVLGTYSIGNPDIDAQPIIAVHQGRVIIAQVTAYDFGPNSAFSTTENLRYTKVFDPTKADISAIQTFVPENPDGYAFIFAMSANELFALKQEGGVAVVGDFSAPTVTNLPMVTGSVDGQRPTASPVGLVYGSRFSGVWSWSHGDGSKLLSPYMNPDFWTLGAGEPLLATRYQFETVDRWVLAPNNYLLDTTTNAWWRLDDPSYAAVRFFSRKDRYIYGAISSYTHASPNAIFTWDLYAGASTYTWTSHPVWVLLNQYVELREVVIEAKGQGTITVTARQADGTAATSASFTLSNTGYAERKRANFEAHTYGLIITVTADSGSSSVNAPTIYSVNVGYRSQQGLPTT